MLRRHLAATVLLVLLVVGAMSGAKAQQPTNSAQAPANPSGWTFNVTPYVWFATINTNMNFALPPALGGTVSADSSVGFGELVPHLHFAAMVAADAQFDRFSILTDVLYLSLGGAASEFRSVNFPNHPSVPISGAVQAGASLNLSATVWTLAGGYTVARGAWGNFDTIVGFRFLGGNFRSNYSLGLMLTGPRGNGATFGGIGSVSGSTDIWNGIAGFRGRLLVHDTALFIPYYFDIGAGGSNLTWQIASGLGYRLGWGDVSITYRYLAFEQGSNVVVQRLAIRGPMIAVNIRF
jgi:hypothetical protein